MEPQTLESLDRAGEVAARHAGPSATATRLGLRVSRVSEQTPLAYQHYAPSLAVVFYGRKRSIVGDEDQLWGREHFLITPVDLPVIAGVVETDPKMGFVSAIWKLDPVVVADVAASMFRRPRPAGVTVPRLGIWTTALADAFARLIALLDAPEDIAVLGPLLEREVILRLLQCDQSPRLLAAAGSGDAAAVRAAVAMLYDRLAEPSTTPTLAAELAVSESTLLVRFREATGMTPVRYLKRLRLGEARRRMLVYADTAAQAAAAVGYRTPSHFSRDYRTAYGRPPAADAAEGRSQLLADQELLPD